MEIIGLCERLVVLVRVRCSYGRGKFTVEALQGLRNRTTPAKSRGYLQLEIRSIRKMERNKFSVLLLLPDSSSSAPVVSLVMLLYTFFLCLHFKCSSNYVLCLLIM